MPPLAGVAEKVTGLPAQIVLLPEVMAMETDGVKTGFTVMTMGLLSVEACAVQAILLVTVHVTVVPLLSVLLE